MPEGRRPGCPSSVALQFFRRPAVAACLVILVLETLIFLYASKDWDLQLYPPYAQLAHESSREGLYPGHRVEYPPMAVVLMLLTDAVARQLPDASVLGTTFPAYSHPRPLANFKVVYRLEMAL